jgi:hypothetical protein
MEPIERHDDAPANREATADEGVDLPGQAAGDPKERGAGSDMGLEEDPSATTVGDHDER